MDSTITRLLALIACGSLFVICDTLAAKWGKSGSVSALVWALILAPLSYLSFGFVNQHYPLAIASAWVTLILVATTVLIGYFYFGEQLTTQQSLGLFLAFCAILLLVF